MDQTRLDDVDRGVLYALQQDARNTTTREIGELVGVTPSTVSNRLSQLEADGIITGHRSIVNYERAGFLLHVLITGTAHVADRNDVARQAIGIRGVVNVRELMVGADNIQIEAVGRVYDDITHIVTVLAELGVALNEEILIRNQYHQPLAFFDHETDP